MTWIPFAAAATILCGVPAALLMHRKFRQAKISAALKIESNNGIVEERFVPIGTIDPRIGAIDPIDPIDPLDQWIGIRGEDLSNPALLILHGGPGCSYSIFTPHLRSWEKHFTIVQWDQRGAGKTFARTGPKRCGEITFEQLTRDAIEVAEYACARLGKDRIFLMASSIGSIFALEVVRRRPALFHAYIGTDQNVGMRRDRAEEFRKVIDRLRSIGLTKGVKALERIGPDPTRMTAADFNAIAQWTMKSDPQGFRRTMQLLKDAVWHAPGWTLKDIRAFVAGMRYSLDQLLPEITRYDAWASGLRFEIPFFIFQGADDVLTTPNLAEAFFNDVVAPVKHMALIPNSGHFAAFLQPEFFLRELRTHVRPLAEETIPATVEHR
jgi:pimeloyl-ACP methyl ester carboxylesterase